jgi:ATP-dependent Lon protease
MTELKKTDIDDQDHGSRIIVPGQNRLKAKRDPDDMELPDELPVLPLRDTVTFPGTVVPLNIQRASTRTMLQDILPEQKTILALAQRNDSVENPGPDDLYAVGTAMMVLKLLRGEDDRQNLIVQGLARMRVADWLTDGPHLRARVEPLAELVRCDEQTEALVLNVRNAARRVIDLSPNIPDEARTVLENIDPPGALADFLATNLQLETSVKQELLEQADVATRLHRVSEELQKQVDLLELSDKLKSQVKDSIDKSQREYFLNEQLKAIQAELGQLDEQQAEVKELRDRIDAADLPDHARIEADRELARLEKIPSASPENNVIRTYLETLVELPWRKASEDQLDVNRAETILNEDHYDLEKVKRRILEYLAVRSLAPQSRGPILCFVGPPGVGKTSLGQSIARALGRKFIRMSLGGMRDEAELRGHRRTYIGAMPGRIIQELRKAGSRNPVFMLDEVDKVGTDFRGDPTSALLEILDPAQNNTFQDHYLDLPFDLSDVMFIGTANYIGNIPAPLRDRMEVLDLPGYTPADKLHIAKQYLVDRQREQNGLKKSQITFKDEVLRTIIREYTREAGVRELERQIGAVCRGVAALVAAKKARSRTVNTKLLRDLLGPRKYESELAQRTSQPGVATGLAYTPTGGTILFVESARYPGKGQLTLTGQIGEVMRESAQAALSLCKTHADGRGYDPEQLAHSDIHVHVPAGAVPKDGPSAGVAMFTSLMSLLTGRAVRPDVAMTGEITLRGLVLPIGGVKEKVIAAKQAGIKHVILPAGNEKDLPEIPDDARKGLTFHFANTVDDALKAALTEAKSRKKKTKRKKKT